MSLFEILLVVIGILLIGGLLFSIIFTMPIAHYLFWSQWRRKDSNHYKRECSDKTIDYHLDMYSIGMKYREEHLKNVKQVTCLSLDGLKLAGEYYDFGYDKVVIMIPGRTETAYYGAYYAETFEKAKCNVLCIDPRCHGESEGTILTLGLKEADDIICWAKLMHDEFNNNHVCFYGLCGGGTASCLALAKNDCPSYIDMFISDGMYYSFYMTYKRHIIALGKPVFPVIFEVMFLIQLHNKVNPYKMAPKKLMKNVKIPLLFLSGDKDAYTMPKEAKKMCDSSPSTDKKLVIIEGGRHSHLRYDNTKQYDEVVKNFLTSH